MTTNSNTKTRYIAFIGYPESLPEDWEDRMEQFGVPIAVSPLHDMDQTERVFEDLRPEEQEIVKNGGTIYKKPHYHFMYIAKNPVTLESVRKKLKRVLGDKTVSHLEIISSVPYYFLYLTHESKDAINKGKFKYDKKDIKYFGGFDIDRYIVLDDSEKRELKNKLLGIVRNEHIVNVNHLLDFIEAEGASYGILSLSEVQDVVTSNPGGFRLFFDANYQEGYRRKNKDYLIVDAATGEIIKNEK